MEEQQNNVELLPDDIPEPETIDTEEGWELEGEITQEEQLELAQLLQQFRDVILAHEIRIAQIENTLIELFKSAQKPKMVVPKGH